MERGDSEQTLDPTQRWALGTLQFYLILYFYSGSSPSDALYHVHHFTFFVSPPPFHPFLLSSIPFSPFSFFPPLLFPKVPGAGRDRRVGWWSTTTTRVFPLHHKPAARQQNMYKC